MRKFKIMDDTELQNINGGQSDFIRGILDGLRLAGFVKHKK